MTGIRHAPWLAPAAVLLLPTTLFAHGVRITAHAHDDSIHGQVYFQGDVPAGNVKITAFDSTGENIGETNTDQQGSFTLRVPAPGDYRLLADTADGHGAETSVLIGKPGDRIQTLEDKIDQLQDQLSRYENTIRFRDVLGGIGYILGIAGIAFYLLGLRRPK